MENVVVTLSASSSFSAVSFVEERLMSSSSSTLPIFRWREFETKIIKFIWKGIKIIQIFSYFYLPERRKLLFRTWRAFFGTRRPRSRARWPFNSCKKEIETARSKIINKTARSEIICLRFTTSLFRRCLLLLHHCVHFMLDRLHIVNVEQDLPEICFIYFDEIKISM